MAKQRHQKSIGFTYDVFKTLERLKLSKSISMSAFVNNAVRTVLIQMGEMK